MTPLFIVGSGRSGSTLLRLMLASHSRISIPPETWYIAPLIAQLPIDAPLTPAQVDHAVSIMTGHYRWSDLSLDAADFRRLIAALSDPWLRDLIEVVYRWYMTKEGKSRWGDKTPNYIEIAPAIATMFPDAKFIHLIRDGRDVAKSFQRQRWYGPWLHDNTKEWTRAVQYDRKWSAMWAEERLLRVRYEDLIVDPEGTLRELCAFIGEIFESEMLSWKRKIEQSVPGRERAIHARLYEDMNAADVSRWKREMTGREVFVAESFMGRWLSQCGYRLMFQSALWSPLFAATRVYCRTILPVVGLQLRIAHSLRARVLRLFRKNCRHKTVVI